MSSDCSLDCPELLSPPALVLGSPFCELCFSFTLDKFYVASEGLELTCTCLPRAGIKSEYHHLLASMPKSCGFGD